MRKHLFSGPPQATKTKRSSDPLSYQPPSEMLFHNIPRKKIADTLCTLSDMIQSQQPLIFSHFQHTSAVSRWLRTWGTAPLYCKNWQSTNDPTDIARHLQKAQQKLNLRTAAIQRLNTQFCWRSRAVRCQKAPSNGTNCVETNYGHCHWTTVELCQRTREKNCPAFRLHS